MPGPPLELLAPSCLPQLDPLPLEVAFCPVRLEFSTLFDRKKGKSLTWSRCLPTKVTHGSYPVWKGGGVGSHIQSHSDNLFFAPGWAKLCIIVFVCKSPNQRFACAIFFIPIECVNPGTPGGGQPTVSFF